MPPSTTPPRATGPAAPERPRLTRRRADRARDDAAPVLRLVRPPHDARETSTPPAPPSSRALSSRPESPAATPAPRTDSPASPRPQPTPIDSATDPRWVLAVRTSECLQGDVLPPEKRDRLLVLARLLRLTPFDANLIFAIVQDQARRGYAAAACPQAGLAQLGLITPPAAQAAPGWGWRLAFLTAGMLAVELAAVAWLTL